MNIKDDRHPLVLKLPQELLVKTDVFLLQTYIRPEQALGRAYAVFLC